MENKPRIFYYGDSPSAHTGFGIVAKNILNGIYDTKKYEIYCLGINCNGDPHDQTHLNVFPTTGDPRGIDRFAPLLNALAPDILFTINDYDAWNFIPEALTRYKQETGRSIKWVAYIPVDGTPVYPEYVDLIKRYVDYPVLYTQFALDEFKKVDKNLELPFVYHGVDRSLFKKLTAKERKAIRDRNKFEGKFIVLAAGVNQLRKQFNLVIQAFSEFAKDKDDVFLYLHTQPNMRWGWDLVRLCKILGISGKSGFTRNATIPVGIPFKDMVEVYNTADVFLTLSCGEGFGLPIIEAATCGLPLIYHDCTVMPEIIGDAGVPIRTDHHYIFPLGDRELFRPIANVSEAVKALELFYKERSLLKEYSKKSLVLSKKDCFKWENAINLFDGIFDEALSVESEDIELEEIL